MGDERLVIGDHGSYHVVGAAFAEGGTGRLFRTRSERWVYKRYVRRERAPDSRQLDRLVSIGREVLISEERTIGECKESSINWPVDVTRGEDGSVTGVILPSIPAACFQDGAVRGLEGLLLPRAHPPRAQARIALLVRMAEILMYLDEVGLVHGDISGKNLVWSLDPAPLMYLIDCDALVPRDPPPTVGVATAGWVDPRLVEKRIPAHDHFSDRYALALALYRGLLLTPGNLHADEHGNWPQPARLDKVPDATLRSMLTDALGNPLDETRRPSPAAWVAALTAAFVTGGQWNTAALGKLDDVADRIADSHRQRTSTPATAFQPLPALTSSYAGTGVTASSPARPSQVPTRPAPTFQPPPPHLGSPAPPVRFPTPPPPVRPRPPAPPRRRWPWIAAAAVLLLCVSGPIVGLFGRTWPASHTTGTAVARWPGAPESPPGQQQDLSESETFDSPPPTFKVAPGGQSRYDAGYRADITSVVPDGFRINVSFDAQGGANLRSPESSCLRVVSPVGELKLAPVRIALTTQQSTHYAGTLTFPLLVPGNYAFDYSCSIDFSDAPIGQADVVTLGISRHSEDHFAVVYAARKSDESVVVLFAAAGSKDLRDPTTSCLGEARDPALNLLVDDRAQGTSFVGTLTFPADSSGQFNYSCANYPGIFI